MWLSSSVIIKSSNWKPPFSPWVINACQIMSTIHFHSHIYEDSCKIKIHRKLRRSFFSWLYIYLLITLRLICILQIYLILFKRNQLLIRFFKYLVNKGIYWIFSLTLFGMGRYFYPSKLLKLNFLYFSESWHKSSLFDSLTSLPRFVKIFS